MLAEAAHGDSNNGVQLIVSQWQAGGEREEKSARSRVNDLVVLSEAPLAAAAVVSSTRRAQEP
jgi:hypothetical protein